MILSLGPMIVSFWAYNVLMLPNDALILAYDTCRDMLQTQNTVEAQTQNTVAARGEYGNRRMML